MFPEFKGWDLKKKYRLYKDREYIGLYICTFKKGEMARSRTIKAYWFVTLTDCLQALHVNPKGLWCTETRKGGATYSLNEQASYIGTYTLEQLIGLAKIEQLTGSF